MLPLKPAAVATLLLAINAAFAETAVLSKEGGVRLARGEQPVTLESQTLRAGDRLITDEAGRLHVRIDQVAELILQPNSQLSLAAVSFPGPAGEPALRLHRGALCLRLLREVTKTELFFVELGGVTRLRITTGKLCAAQDDTRSSVRLIEGNVLIEQKTNPNTIILSEAGSRYRVGRSGEFELIPPKPAGEQNGFEDPFTPPADAGTPPADTGAVPPRQPDDNTGAATVEPGAGEPEAQTGTGGETAPAQSGDTGRYIVYLFSTRARNVAAKINRRLHQAGHPTRIFEAVTDDVTRYRLGMPGFDTLEDAKRFADSIQGQHGITEAWVAPADQ